MKNQQGVTVVELLVAILLMGVILTPITFLVSHSLTTEREVAMKNDLQREARFIMGQISEKMRDSSNYWFEADGNWVLCEYADETDSCNRTYLTYSPGNEIMYLRDYDGQVLANQITLTLDPEPTAVVPTRMDMQKVHLQIVQGNESIEMETTIYFNRY